MTIHATDPFATPEPDRSPVRRLRGRLLAPVTLWTAPGSAGPGPDGGPGPAGLTVSSMLVADGDPGRVLGLVDDESELWEAASAAGWFAVCPLLAGEHRLADRFAGLAPAPGGRFRDGSWRETGYGPVPDGDRTWAGCRLDGARRFGWGLLVEGTVVEVTVGGSGADAGADDAGDGAREGDPAPLAYYRGRYRALGK